MCKNKPGQGQFTCLCRTGYTGAHCSSTLDPCAANPCSNSAQCVQLKQGRFKCVCPAGWGGPLYAESPCLLGSNCTDLIDDFACSCPAGFTGKRCETKVDMCHGPPSRVRASTTAGVGRTSTAAPTATRWRVSSVSAGQDLLAPSARTKSTNARPSRPASTAAPAPNWSTISNAIVHQVLKFVYYFPVSLYST